MKKLAIVLMLFLMGCATVPQDVEVKEVKKPKVVVEEKDEDILGKWKVATVKIKDKEIPYEDLKGKVEEKVFKELDVELSFTEKEVSFKVDNKDRGTTGYKVLEKNKYQDNFKLFEFVIKGSKLEVSYNDTTMVFKKVK